MNQRRLYTGQRAKPIRLGRPAKTTGELDPPCQDSPTLYSTPNLIVQLDNGYYRFFNPSTQFSYHEYEHYQYKGAGGIEPGTDYDRTELLGLSRHDLDYTADRVNLLVNLPNGTAVGGPPFGGDVSVVVTNNAGTSTTNVTATWDGNWSQPRWMVAAPLTVDGVNLSGYIAHVNPVGSNDRLRWWINSADDNPTGVIGTDFFDDTSPNWCGRSASFGFGAGGPTATATWSKQSPRGVWWNPGGGGSFVPMTDTGSQGNAIPSGGSDDHLDEYGLPSGTKVSRIYVNEPPFGAPAIQQFQHIAPWLPSVNYETPYNPPGSSASVWTESYVEPMVEMDLAWAGASNPETWSWLNMTGGSLTAFPTLGGTPWTWARSLNKSPWVVPQTGWLWEFVLSFEEVNPDDLSDCRVVLWGTLRHTYDAFWQTVPREVWVWTAAVDFSTNLEDELFLTRNYTLNDDSAHVDHTGHATGAQTFLKSISAPGSVSDYSVTIPSSINVMFFQKIERALGIV